MSRTGPPDADTPPAPDAGPGDRDMGRDASMPAPDASPDMAPPGPALPDYMDPAYDPNRAFRGRQQDLFACQDPSAPTALEGITYSRFRRLGSVEWVRNAGMFFGTRHTSARRLTADGGRNPFGVQVKGGFSTWRGQALMDKAIISGHIDLMPYASRAWTARRHRSAQDGALDCMYDDAAVPDRACAQAFVTSLLENAVYFRAPSDEEVAQLTDHAVGEVLTQEAAIGQTRAQSIELIFSAAWLTTGALHRSEWGSGAPDALGRVKLTDWEIAHKIGYALKRRAPGAPSISIGYGGSGEGATAYDLPPEERANGYHLDAFLQAARDGTISDPQVLGDLIRAHASGEDPKRFDLPVEWRHRTALARRATPYLSEGVRRFFREWLEAERLTSIFKDTPYATSKHDDLDEVIGTSGEWPRRGALKAISNSYTRARLGPHPLL